MLLEFLLLLKHEFLVQLSEEKIKYIYINRNFCIEYLIRVARVCILCVLFNKYFQAAYLKLTQEDPSFILLIALIELTIL